MVSDPEHWLFRLSADEWHAAAETELRHARDALGRRAFRPGVTHARRAAGMALNAVLAHKAARSEQKGLEIRWGRSYMDHLVLAADDPELAEDVRAACRLLRQIAPSPPTLISIVPDRRAETAASSILAWARMQTTLV